MNDEYISTNDNGGNGSGGTILFRHDRKRRQHEHNYDQEQHNNMSHVVGTVSSSSPDDGFQQQQEKQQHVTMAVLVMGDGNDDDDVVVVQKDQNTDSKDGSADVSVAIESFSSYNKNHLTESSNQTNLFCNASRPKKKRQKRSESSSIPTVPTMATTTVPGTIQIMKKISYPTMNIERETHLKNENINLSNSNNNNNKNQHDDYQYNNFEPANYQPERLQLPKRQHLPSRISLSPIRPPSQCSSSSSPPFSQTISPIQSSSSKRKNVIQQKSCYQRSIETVLTTLDQQQNFLFESPTRLLQPPPQLSQQQPPTCSPPALQHHHSSKNTILSQPPGTCRNESKTQYIESNNRNDFQLPNERQQHFVAVLAFDMLSNHYHYMSILLSRIKHDTIDFFLSFVCNKIHKLETRGSKRQVDLLLLFSLVYSTMVLSTGLVSFLFLIPLLSSKVSTTIPTLGSAILIQPEFPDHIIIPKYYTSLYKNGPNDDNNNNGNGDTFDPSSSRNTESSTMTTSNSHDDSVPTQLHATNGSKKKRPLTLRDILLDMDDRGYHLALAPAFFGFYGYFGIFEAWEQEVYFDTPIVHWMNRNSNNKKKTSRRKNTSVQSIVGASAGAMAAVLLGAGIRPKDALQFVANIQLHDYADFPGVFAIFRGNQFERLMYHFLLSKLQQQEDDNSNHKTNSFAQQPSLQLQDTIVPVAVSAFDIQTMEGIIIQYGSMARAARASATFPFLFQPVGWYDPRIEQEYILIDGGITDPNGIAGLNKTILQPYDDDETADRKVKKDNTQNKKKKSLQSRVINISIGDFFMSNPPGPSNIIGKPDVLSISIRNLPQPGPWNMLNGLIAADAAKKAMIESLDVPLFRRPKNSNSTSNNNKDSEQVSVQDEEGHHYELHIDASSFWNTKK